MRIAAALKRAVSWAAPTVIAGSVAMVVPASWAFSADPGAVKSPVVVELYQSQGCSDCPPAQDFLNRLAGQPGVLALSFGVTYWDYLGWKDSFAAPAFTQRQRDYAARNGDREIATPQYWIDGRTTILGANPARVAQAIGQSHRTGGPAVTLSGNRLTIGQGRADRGGADIWLVRYDPRTIEVPIRAGENGGRTLPHRDIVREMSRVGHWEGAAISIPFGAAADPAWKTAVLLQAGKGGPILAAATS